MDDVTCHVSHGKIGQVLVAEEGCQSGPDQVVRTGEVCDLVHQHRAALLEGVQILLNHHCLGHSEVEAVVLELLCFSGYPVQQYDALYELAPGLGEGKHLW